MEVENLSHVHGAPVGSFPFEKLPDLITEKIFDLVGLEGLKQLRLTGNRTILFLVDKFLTGKKACEKTKLEIHNSTKGQELSTCPTKFVHSKLVLAIPDHQDLEDFYRSDLRMYLYLHAKNIKKIVCSWFFGFSQATEHAFFSAFENLESFTVQKTFDFTIFDFSIQPTPKGFLNLKSITIPWFDGIESIGIFNNETFLPSKIRLCDITDETICTFFETMNEHLKMRQTRSRRLKVLQIAEQGLETSMTVPANLFAEFAQYVTCCQTLIQGMSESLLKKMELVVDRKPFLEFLKWQKTIYGFHPLMRTICLDQLESVFLRQCRITIRDERWQEKVSGNKLTNLKDLEMWIDLDHDTTRRDRNPELRAVENVLNGLLDAATTNLKNLNIKIAIPSWYPLFLPIENYVENFKQLDCLDLNAELKAQQIKMIFKALRSTKISCISLTKCHVTDDTFRGDSSTRSYFLELKDLESFSICSYSPVSKQFLTSSTLIDVFAQSFLKQLRLEGSFSAVTAEGVRYLSHGRNLSNNLIVFNLKLPEITSSMKDAESCVQKVCARNFRRVLFPDTLQENS